MRTKINNVVRRDQYIYGLDDQNLACQNLATGEILWCRPKNDGYGQILRADDLLIVQSENGEVSLGRCPPRWFHRSGEIHRPARKHQLLEPPGIGRAPAYHPQRP